MCKNFRKGVCDVVHCNFCMLGEGSEYVKLADSEKKRRSSEEIDASLVSMNTVVMSSLVN